MINWERRWLKLFPVVLIGLFILSSLVPSSVSALTVSTEQSGDRQLVVLSSPTERSWKMRRDGRYLDIRANEDLADVAEALEPILQTMANVELTDESQTQIRVTAVASGKFSSATSDSRELKFELIGKNPELQFRIGRHPSYIRLVIEADRLDRFRVQQNGDELTVTSTLPSSWQGIGQLTTLSDDITVNVQGPTQLSLKTELAFKTFTLENRMVVIDFDLGGIAGAPAKSAAIEPQSTTIERKSSDPPLVETVVASPAASPIESDLSEPAPLTNPLLQVAAAPSPQLTFPAVDEVVESEPEVVRAELIVGSSREGGIPKLELNWGQKVPVAVFWRQDRLWVVARSIGAIESDPAAIRRNLGTFVARMEQVAHPSATILVLTMLRQADLEVVSTEVGWTIGFKPMTDSIGPYDPLAISDGRLLIGSAVSAIEVVDPVIGDDIVAMVANEPNAAKRPYFKATDFDMLEAWVGAAFNDHGTTLTTQRVDVGVIIQREGGLRLAADSVLLPPTAATLDAMTPVYSSPAEQARSANQLADKDLLADTSIDGQESPNIQGLSLTQFQILSAQPLLVGLRELAMNRIVREPVDRVQAALDRSRLYLAHGLVQEALTSIEVARRNLQSIEQPAAVLENSLELLEGASRNLMPPGRPALLTPARFDADDEVSLWRTIAQMRLSEWQFDIPEMTQAREILTGYPSRLQALLGAEFAANLIDMGHLDAAFVIIDELEKLDLQDTERSKILHLKGNGFVRDGYLDRGLRLLSEAEELVDFNRQHQITVDRLLVEIQNERTEPTAALAVLQNLQPFWRGLTNEAELLSAVGDIYLADRQIAQALKAWRRAVDRVPEDAASFVEQMRRHFTEFINGDGWQRSPFEALEIMRTYRELMPPGTDSERLIIDLAGDFADQGYPELSTALLGQLVSSNSDYLAEKNWLELHQALISVDPNDTENSLQAMVELAPATAIYPVNAQEAFQANVELLTQVDEEDGTAVPFPAIVEPLDELSSTMRRGELKLLDSRILDDALLDMEPETSEPSLNQILPTHLSQPDEGSTQSTSLTRSLLDRFANEQQRVQELTSW